MSHVGKSRGIPEPPASGPGAGVRSPNPGKQTLVEQIVAPAVPQRVADRHDQRDETAVHAAASQSVTTPASALPFSDTLQRVFGRHDISSIQAHTGPEAAASAQAMGAQGVTASDLEALCKELLATELATRKRTP